MTGPYMMVLPLQSSRGKNNTIFSLYLAWKIAIPHTEAENQVCLLYVKWLLRELVILGIESFRFKNENIHFSKETEKCILGWIHLS